MPAVSTKIVETGDVTLVEVSVAAEEPSRVTLEIRSGGPVWPPRGDDSAVRWTEHGVAVDVGPAPAGIGFATPALPDSIAVELAASEPLDTLPEGVAAWLDHAESRVVTAERVAEADDLRAATAVVADLGGLAELEALAAELARDRRLMSRLSFVPPELCERANDVELPVETFARLAQSRSS